jgi:hypothetical protein
MLVLILKQKGRPLKENRKGLQAEQMEPLILLAEHLEMMYAMK